MSSLQGYGGNYVTSRVFLSLIHFDVPEVSPMQVNARISAFAGNIPHVLNIG
jgi:hypothetical protein